MLSRFVASARQLAKALEVPLVNDLGYTKRYVRCLQVMFYLLSHVLYYWKSNPIVISTAAYEKIDNCRFLFSCV